MEANNIQTIKIIYRDQTTNRLSIYEKEKNNLPLILILPALGIRASFYKYFSEELSQKGITTATIDWRGNGNSSIRPSRRIDFNYKILLEDIIEIVYEIKKIYPSKKMIILGHSLGGQLACLSMARYPQLIQKVMTIASCNVYYKGFGKGAKKVYYGSSLISFISSIWGYYPGNIFGFAGKEAKSVMKNWAETAKTGNYNVKKIGFNYEDAMQKCTNPITAFSIEDDDLAPPLAVDFLIDKFKNASSKKHIHLLKKDYGVAQLNHFNWTKHPHYLIDLMIKEIEY